MTNSPIEESMSFPRLTNIEKYVVDYSQLGNDYIFSRILPTSKELPLLRGPMRLSGFTLCVVMDGELSLEINTRPFRLTRRSLMVLNSNSVLHITDVVWDNIDAYVLFISPHFMHDINIDINALSLQSLITKEPSPIMQMSALEEKVMAEYMHLMHHNAVLNANSVFSKNIARSLIQATIYQLMQIASKLAADTDLSEAQPNRRINYVKEFMKLAQMHHFRERSLNFYAEKLFISPKYLSRIIKESTGRSAAEWIDQFVILEAKNMLRFSNKNIQQVAYSLNFSTQSSFGKFFKHLTGMSPSDYQKT